MRAEAEHDFTTIDWHRDTRRERQFASSVRARAAALVDGTDRLRGGLWGGVGRVLPAGCGAALWRWYHRAQGWLLVLIIGAATGLLAAVVDIGVKFVGDLRRGVYYGDTGRLWLDEVACCHKKMKKKERSESPLPREGEMLSTQAPTTMKEV